MKKVVPILFIVLYALFCFSCQIGLGEEVDLEAPILNLKTMISGETEIDSSHFGGGLYCRKNVIFKGVATDNKAVEKVYAEIKWSDQEDFSYYADAILEGDNFTFNFNLEKQGVAYIKFVVTDKSKNFGIKSSKVVTLLVDEDAPVASAWYIDRNLNGIRYSLKTLEELKKIDLTLPENKDAAQNVSFSIHSAFKDVMGIKPGSISIQIKDENQQLICEVPNSVSNDYSPKFEITEEMLVAADSSLKSGIHYLQVWYNAEDVVTIPESNKAQDVQVEGGWFIWWPESDNPKVTQKPVVDEVSKSILLNVSEAVTVTVFDDDAIKEAYCALLTESEYALIKDSYKTDPAKLIEVVPDAEKSARTVKSEPSTTKRDEVFTFVAPKSPQVMYLAYYVKDSGGKITTADHVVNVTDATSPILYIASPSNNEIPSVEMKNDNKNAFVTVTGQTIDTSGCTYLEFVWVPDVVETDNVKKSTLAKNFLNSLNTDGAHNTYAPKENDNVKVSEVSNLKVWSVKLGKEENTENGYKKQDFKFTMDLLNDFICNGNNEKNNNKFFVVKVTRKDGKSSLQEYKLSADTTKPIIKSISPENTTQIIGSTQDFKLQFYAEKSNGLAIDTSKYTITGKLDGAEIPKDFLPTGEMKDNCFTTTISADTLKGYETSSKRPIYTFTAEDIFGNINSTSYTLIVSSLPAFKSVTSSSPDSCKKGDKITFNANFSDTINNNGSFETNPPKLILQGFSDNKDREAKYVSGVGSPTLVFEYTTQEGDSSEGIIIKKTDGKGYIDTNGNTALEDGVDVHIYKDITPEVLVGKTIKVDAVSPKVENYAIETSVSANEKDRKYYLNQGKTITATLTLSENVFVQGTPKFKFTNDKIELDFVGSSSNSITFSGVVPAGFNGALEYNPSECITNSDKITDTSGNVLLSSATTSNQQTDIIIDTTAPNAPAVKSKDNTELTDSNYKESVTFKIFPDDNDNDVVKYEYSLDAGTSWKVAKNDGTDKVSQSYAELTARVTDKAGNVSAYPIPPIKLNIESSFPAFSVDCLTPNGNYKKGDEIKFRIYFEKEVNLSDKGDAKITVGNNKYATVKTEHADNLKQIDFSYTVKDGDDFYISVNETSVSLGGAVEDLFGFMQGDFKPTSVPSSIKIHCDAVAPTVTYAIPNDGTTESQNFTANTKNIYKTGNEIRITFSEPVQKGSGNLILRQTAGWAIPPVLTAEEFNTICSELKEYKDKNILARQDENGKLAEDMEDLGLGIETRNNGYHGTGQYIGPYKKSMQGIKLENGNYVPDIDTKFVLDFDIGIWETTETHPIEKTFDENHAYKAPTSTTSAGEIRTVLEKAGLHQRVLDVTSANVKVNGKVVTITFPKGLIDKTDALPDGREWELVFEKGTFLDITGNEFGTEKENKILINEKGSFYSDKVATPVIRVDRYSYGLGIIQVDKDGNPTDPIANDGVKPTGYVRVRIDCETKGATVVYSETKQSKNNENTPSNPTYENEGSTESWKPNDVAKSYCTTTNITSHDEPKTTYENIFAVGSGNYKASYKGIIAAKAKRDSFIDSLVGVEGVFQTVVFMNAPTYNDGNNKCADAGINNTDVSIRGTTGFAGEPYISPFPLRDTRIGSPYLRIIFRESTQQGKTDSKDYYWISYEVLVESSFSNYSWHKKGFYDWACNWGLMKPGEFTRVVEMTNWG